MAFILFSKKKKTFPDFILAIWMCIIGFHILAYHFYFLGLWEKFPFLFGTTALFPLLHPPLLYLYTSYSLNGKSKLDRKDYVHFIPALVSYIHIFQVILFYSPENKMLLDKGEIDDSFFITSVLITLIISIVFYTIQSFRKLMAYRNILELNFSYEKNINLRWLRYWILGFAGVFSVVIVVIFLRQFLNIDYGFNMDLIFYFLVIALIIALGYFGIVNQGIFNAKGEDLIKKEKYEKSSLSDNKSKEIQTKLLKLMSEQKPYLNPKLSLSELANMIDTSPNELSQIINSYQKTNFYEFVNQYRIDEFKNQATLHPHYSILALAYESGFNSKSSFNDVFKRKTQQTPSKFIESLKKEST